MTDSPNLLYFASSIEGADHFPPQCLLTGLTDVNRLSPAIEEDVHPIVAVQFRAKTIELRVDVVFLIFGAEEVELGLM